MAERNKKMKVLLVYPEFPNTYWSFKHALPFAGKRSAYPAARPAHPLLDAARDLGKTARGFECPAIARLRPRMG